MNATAGREGETAGNETRDALTALRHWLAHYDGSSSSSSSSTPSAAERPWLGCYQPWNYQSRALVVDDCVPHNNVCVGCPTAGQETATHYTCNEGRLTKTQRHTTCTCSTPRLPLLRPALRQAVAGMRSVQWVGLTDFYHESMYARARSRASSAGPDWEHTPASLVLVPCHSR